MLRQIAARLEVVEIAQRRGRHLEDVSDDEIEEEHANAKPSPVMDQGEEIFLKALTSLKSTPHFNPLEYGGKLDSDELVDWITKMEKYFEYENIPEDKKVNIASTKLKSHASLWWEHLQLDRKRKRKDKIKVWSKMVNKLKGKLLPYDYQINLVQRMQSLRQKDSLVKEYTEEFYILDIRSGHDEDDVEKIGRYLNGLRVSIQEEISMVKLENIEEAYKFALKAEEKLNKGHEKRQRGCGGRLPRGRGRSNGENGRSEPEKQNLDRAKTEWKGESYKRQRQ